MNKRVKRTLLAAAGVAAACGIVWGGMALVRNAQRGNVNVYAVSDFSMTDYWGDTSQTSGTVSTDKMQKAYLSNTQKVSKIYVEVGQTVKKGDRLLSYDTTLTSLDIERAQIAYEKQKLALEDAKKALERLQLAQDQEALEEKITELQAQIDTLIAANIDQWLATESKPIASITGDEVPVPLAEPAGDGSKDKPLYFNWNAADEISPEHLARLLPEGKASAYVVLIIREGNMTLGDIQCCYGFRLEWVKPDQSTEPDEPDVPTSESLTDEETTESPGSVAPPATTQTVRCFPENLPAISQERPDGITDEVLALQKEIEALQELEAYPKAERAHMIREKLNEMAELDVSIKLAAINLEKTKKEVGSDTLYSELDGTIKAVRDPNSADFTTDQAVVEVSGGGGYYIKGALSELELGAVSVGSTVQINSWMTGASCEGEIVEISDYPTDSASSWSDGNSNVSYYPFTVFVSEEAELQEGDWVEMSYQNTADMDGDTLYLESMFIRTENGKSYVLARNESGRLEKRWVQTGRSLWGSYTQIRGGLTVDDFVAFPYGRSAVEGATAVEATSDQLYNGM